jgi:hypothetical protein
MASQSMNIFMGAPTRGKVKAMLMWGGMRASKQGLLFEIRSLPSGRNSFTIEPNMSKKTEILRASIQISTSNNLVEEPDAEDAAFVCIPCLQNLVCKNLYIRVYDIVINISDHDYCRRNTYLS